MLITGDTVVTSALGAVLRDHGWLVAEDASRLRAMLNDLLGEHADTSRAYVDALVLSVDEGVPGQVRMAGRALLPVVTPDLVEALMQWGLAPERAAWVVDAWSAQLPATTAFPQPEQVHPPTPDTPARRPRRWVQVAVAAAVLAAGGFVFVRPSFAPEPRVESQQQLTPRAAGTELVVVDTVEPTPITPVAMATRRDGVAVSALSSVPEYVDARGRVLEAPEGGELIAFRLTDWACGADRDDCRGWSDARLSVEVDGEARPLPETDDDTFVVAVPDGARAVDLVLASGGQRQSVSLLTATAAAGNLAVLARDQRELTLDRDFSVTERVSIPIDYGDGVGRRHVERRATITSASLEYWARPGVTASAPDRALLKVNLWFNYPQDDAPGETVWYWRSDQVSFRDADGRVVQPVRLPGTRGAADEPWWSHTYYFDVPAAQSNGTLLVGGGIDVLSQEGTSYHATTRVTEFPIHFG